MPKVILEYSFIFDPSETWQSGNAFDSSLAKLFDQVGLEAEVVEYSQQATKKILIIRKKSMMPYDEADQKHKQMMHEQKVKKGG